MHPAIMAYLTDDVPRRLSWKKPQQPGDAQPQPQPVQKGVCRYCGDHIGRGVAFHEKACPERPHDDAR